MDSETLFWILVLGAPVLSRLLRGKKKPQKRPPVPRQMPRAREKADQQPTPFQEALRQIQEALAEGQRRTQTPAPTPPASQAPEQPRLERTPPKPTRLPPRQSPPMAPTPEFHGLETSTKPSHFFDEPFDKEAPFTAPGRDEHFHAPLTDEAETAKTVQLPKPKKKLSKWQQTVMNIALLGPPRSRRPWSDPSRR